MKQKTLSEKGFEIDPNSPDYNTAYYEEDVKEFIKEILDEIEKHIDNKKELKLVYKMHEDMGEYGRGYVDCYKQTNDVFKEIKQIIKEKAGKELIEDG